MSVLQLAETFLRAKRLGKVLLYYAVEQTRRAVIAYAVIVDAKDENDRGVCFFRFESFKMLQLQFFFVL